MGLTYTTVEAVKAAAGYSGAEEDSHVKRLLDSVTSEIERTFLRNFYPLTTTRYYEFPGDSLGKPWLLWLDSDLIKVTAIDSAGTAITEYFEEPVNSGPPYNRIELDLAENDYFRSGDTWQRSIAITGRWGYSEDSEAAGALAVAMNNSQLTAIVKDSSLVGIGDLILIGAERMVVTAKALLTTGTTISSDLDADEAVTTIPVADGTKVKTGELITIDSERMRVDAVAGNNLTVQRNYDGSNLATHTSGATVYAPRTLTVERAAVGTTIVLHLINATISRNVAPGLIRELCLAEVLFARVQEKGHMAASVGVGETQREISGRAVIDVRKRAEAAYARRRGPRAI